MGRNRSVAVSVMWLVRQGIFTLYDAVQHIAERREKVLFNDSFMRLLVEDMMKRNYKYKSD